MKKQILLIASLFIGMISFAQTGFNYKALITDNNNALVSQSVDLRFSLLQGATIVYQETNVAITDANGIVSVFLGEGTPVSSDFATLDWSNSYLLKVEIDINDGSGYQDFGTNPLQYVPQAKYAEKAGNVFSGSYNDLTDKPNIIDTISNVIDTTSQFIRKPNNLAKGDILVYNGSRFDRLPKGIDNQILTMRNGIPTWMYKANISDSIYSVYLNSTDEDYVNFGTFQNFTNNADWSIIEKVKMPTGTGSDGGWHFFRGKAWEDIEGDIAIQLNSTQVYAWCQKNGWQSVSYNSTFQENQWYTICFQYNSSTQTLELYVDGTLVGQQGGIFSIDDSNNTNNLFFGGQDVDPSHGRGDLYSEASIIVAHQAWLQRLLTPAEIQNYDGYIALEPALFFSTGINSDSVIDTSNHGHNGTNGNTPEFLKDLP